MPVRHIHSEAELDSLITSQNNNADKLLLVHFSAEWCGPCKMIAPLFESLSNKYGHANFLFLHVDVDEMGELSESQSIRAMPTFVFYKNSLASEITRIQGADPSKLESKISELSVQYKAHFTGEGNKLGGGGPTVTASGSACNLSSAEIIQIAQANVEYSLSDCCRVGFRFLPAVQGGVLAGANVSKLRVFIDSLLEMSGVNQKSYELHNSYTPGKLDESMSINSSSVAGAVVVVKFL